MKRTFKVNVDVTAGQPVPKRAKKSLSDCVPKTEIVYMDLDYPSYPVTCDPNFESSSTTETGAMEAESTNCTKPDVKPRAQANPKPHNQSTEEPDTHCTEVPPAITTTAAPPATPTTVPPAAPTAVTPAASIAVPPVTPTSVPPATPTSVPPVTCTAVPPAARGFVPSGTASPIIIDDNCSGPRSWVKIGNSCPDDPDYKFVLYLEIKTSILEKNYWLTDSEIHTGQLLLKKDLPHVDGLHDPAVKGSLAVPATSEFV